MEQIVNTFSQGLNMDLNPLVTPSEVLTNCLNGTLLTYNGNDMVLQNDMGNGKVETAALWPGYVPVGMKLHGGIIYVASYNPQTLKSLIGCFPSPERNIEDLVTNGGMTFSLGDNIKQPLFSNGSLHGGDKFVAILPGLDCSNITPSFNKDGTIYSDRNRRYTVTINILNNNGELVDITSECNPIQYGTSNSYYWFTTNLNVLTYSVCRGNPAGKPYICCKENQVITMSASILAYIDPDADSVINYRPEVDMTYNCPRFTSTSSTGLKGFQVSVSTLGSNTAASTKTFEIKDCPENLTEDGNYTLSYYDSTSYTALPKSLNTSGTKIQFAITPIFNYGSDKLLTDKTITVTMDVDMIGNNTTTLTTWKTSFEDTATIITYGFDSYISNDDFNPKDMIIKFHAPVTIDDKSLFNLTSILNSSDVAYEIEVESRSSYHGVFSEYIDTDDLPADLMYIAEISFTTGPDNSKVTHKYFRPVFTTSLYDNYYLSGKDICATENNILKETPIIEVNPSIVSNPSIKKVTSETTLTSTEGTSLDKVSLIAKDGGTLTLTDYYEYLITPSFSISSMSKFPLTASIESMSMRLKSEDYTGTDYSYDEDTNTESLTYSDEGYTVTMLKVDSKYLISFNATREASYSYTLSVVVAKKYFETYEARNLDLTLNSGLVKFHTTSNNDIGSRDDYYLKYCSFNSSGARSVKDKTIWNATSDKNLCFGRLYDLQEEITTACKSTQSSMPVAVQVVFGDIYIVESDSYAFMQEYAHHRPERWYWGYNWLVYNGEEYIMLNSNLMLMGEKPIKDNDEWDTSNSTISTTTNPYHHDGILKDFAVCTQTNKTINNCYVLKVNDSGINEEDISYTLNPVFTSEVKLYYNDYEWDNEAFTEAITSYTEDSDIKSQLSLVARFFDFEVGTPVLSTKNLMTMDFQKSGKDILTALNGNSEIDSLISYGYAENNKLSISDTELDEENVYRVSVTKDEKNNDILTLTSASNLVRLKLTQGAYHALFQTYGDTICTFLGSDAAKLMYYGKATVSGYPDIYIVRPGLNSSILKKGMTVEGTDFKGPDSDSGINISRINSSNGWPSNDTIVIPVFYNSVKGANGRMIIDATYPSACVDLLDDFKTE